MGYLINNMNVYSYKYTSFDIFKVYDISNISPDYDNNNNNNNKNNNNNNKSHKFIVKILLDGNGRNQPIYYPPLILNSTTHINQYNQCYGYNDNDNDNNNNGSVDGFSAMIPTFTKDNQNIQQQYLTDSNKDNTVYDDFSKITEKETTVCYMLFTKLFSKFKYLDSKDKSTNIIKKCKKIEYTHIYSKKSTFYTYLTNWAVFNKPLLINIKYDYPQFTSNTKILFADKLMTRLYKIITTTNADNHNIQTSSSPGCDTHPKMTNFILNFEYFDFNNDYNLSQLNQHTFTKLIRGMSLNAKKQFILELSDIIELKTKLVLGISSIDYIFDTRRKRCASYINHNILKMFVL